jgi:hypothetical protein
MVTTYSLPIKHRSPDQELHLQHLSRITGLQISPVQTGQSGLPKLNKA